MADDESNFEFGDKPSEGDDGDLASRIDSLENALDSAVRLIDALRAEVSRLDGLQTSENTKQQNHIEELYRRINSTTEVADSGGGISGKQCTTLLGNVTAIRFDKPLMATLSAGTLTVSLATTTIDVVTSGECAGGEVSLTTTNIKVIDDSEVC